jgi:hypothetical protein
MRLADPIDLRDGYASKLNSVSDAGFQRSRAGRHTLQRQATAALRRLTADMAGQDRAQPGGMIAAALEKVTPMNPHSQQFASVFGSDSPPEEERCAHMTSWRE